ncbi:MAG TPA: MlaD family protein [Acidimicrobiales bacterium]|jgi:virulence factor Mce-like protein
MTKAHRAVGSVAILLLVLSACVVAVRAAYGEFADTYEVSALFPRAGEAMRPGADVKVRGVNVGEVSGIRLEDRRVRITMEIDDDVRIPTDVTATVKPKTLFGEKFVDLEFTDGAGGPFLADGDEIAEAGAATEVEEMVAGLTPLFEGIDETELATLLSELTEAAAGQGDDVARSLDSAAAATDVLADTIDQQLAALDSWAAFQEAIRSIGPDLNAISANSNLSLPEFNAHEADFQRVLTTVKPFADDLADLLATYRPDIDTMLDRGENVVRVLLAREREVSETIYGLSRYVLKLGTASSAETLPDGTKFAYFKNFILFDDIERALCEALAPPEGAPPELAALRDALLGSGSVMDCAGYAESPPTEGPGTPELPGLPAPPAAGQPPAPQAQAGAPGAVQDLVDDLGAGIGAVDTSQPATVEVLVDRILGSDR